MSKGKLHQVLAVERKHRSTFINLVKEAADVLGKKHELFWGQTRKIVFSNEARANENATEVKPISDTVRNRLNWMAGKIVPFFDATLQKDLANMSAKATLTVDGVEIAKDVPVCHLLTLESRLAEIKRVYLNIPTLEAGIEWVADQEAGADRHRQKEPAVSFRTEKTFSHKVLVEPTQYHPAQVEKWTIDVPVARIETLKVSGAMTSAQKADFLTRVDKLIAASVDARMRANDIEVESVRIGSSIFNYLHGNVGGEIAAE